VHSRRTAGLKGGHLAAKGKGAEKEGKKTPLESK